MNKREIANTAIDIAREAGRLILDIYRSSSLDVSLKEDGSPVTRADMISDEYISKSLKNQLAIEVVSEESSVDFNIRKDWDRFFLVDPLDGTKDFVARNDEFTINIALVEDKKPVIGVVYAPAKDEMFFGVEGEGSFFIDSSANCTRLPCMRPNNAIAGISRFHNSNETDVFLKENNIYECRKIGSALKFCYLARGDISIYPRFNGSKEWDIAAGHVILAEAGGRIFLTDNGREPLYNKEDIRNGHFIAVSGDFNLNTLIRSYNQY